jgi:hypothetical protein
MMMGFLKRFFGRGAMKEVADESLERLHEKTSRDLGMSEQFIPDEVEQYRRRRAQNAAATAHWPRDKNGNFL